MQVQLETTKEVVVHTGAKGDVVVTVRKNEVLINRESGPTEKVKL